ncbi:MAG TPA: NUDIX domain-containing protein [Candidatus Baltobacteraceae bacterium]|nr:NUDIX domain-containing protein [Candidatus Baltobacteraceae bacterium]
MKLVLTPSRHGVPLKPGERRPTPEENSAAIARGRHEMAVQLMRRFPQAKILGIEGKGELLIEIPDGDPDLPARIRRELDVETGPDPAGDPLDPVWRSDLQPTAEAVAEAHRAKEYRPTVVVVVRDAQGRFLLVQSRFNPDEWMLVQGGIEEGESLFAALTRELREEIKAGPRRTRSQPPTFLGIADLDAEEGRTDKRGFTKGKRYFIYEVAYRGPETLKLQESELSAYAWVGPRLDDPELLKRLARVRPGKSKLLIGAIIRALS